MQVKAVLPRIFTFPATPLAGERSANVITNLLHVANALATSCISPGQGDSSAISQERESGERSANGYAGTAEVTRCSSGSTHMPGSAHGIFHNCMGHLGFVDGQSCDLFTNASKKQLGRNARFSRWPVEVAVASGERLNAAGIGTPSRSGTHVTGPAIRNCFRGAPRIGAIRQRTATPCVTTPKCGVPVGRPTTRSRRRTAPPKSSRRQVAGDDAQRAENACGITAFTAGADEVLAPVVGVGCLAPGDLHPGGVGVQCHRT